jgi:hypothetical protein
MGMNNTAVFALFSAFAWVIAVSAVHAEELSADQYAARAVQFVKEGNQEAALAGFYKAVELAPD